MSSIVSFFFEWWANRIDSLPKKQKKRTWEAPHLINRRGYTMNFSLHCLGAILKNRMPIDISKNRRLWPAFHFLKWPHFFSHTIPRGYLPGITRENEKHRLSQLFSLVKPLAMGFTRIRATLSLLLCLAEALTAVKQGPRAFTGKGCPRSASASALHQHLFQ
jgi:hypothetical protein